MATHTNTANVTPHWSDVSSPDAPATIQWHDEMMCHYSESLEYAIKCARWLTLATGIRWYAVLLAYGEWGHWLIEPYPRVDDIVDNPGEYTAIPFYS